MEPETAGFEPSPQLLTENKNYEAAALPSEPSLLDGTEYILFWYQRTTDGDVAECE